MTDSNKKSDFDNMVEKLKRNVNEQERMVFSKKVIKEYNSPKNIGKMAQPDAFAILTGWYGDTMEIFSDCVLVVIFSLLNTRRHL